MPGRAASAQRGAPLSRRAFVGGALALVAWPRGARPGTPAPPMAGLVRADGSVVPELVPALEQSEFAYVSPLRSDGSASTCHGEVWYAWLDDTIVTTTSRESWKARAVARGLDRARIWIGSYGRWKRIAGGRNEAFRRGPNFVAHASVEPDAAVLDPLLEVYGRKYPGEIGRWRERMRREVASGERVILRYRLLPSPAPSGTAGEKDAPQGGVEPGPKDAPAEGDAPAR